MTYFDRKASSLEKSILEAVSKKIDEAKVVLDLENDDPKLIKDIKKFGLRVKDNGPSGNAGFNEYEIMGPKNKIDAANKKLNLMAGYGMKKMGEKLVGGQKKLDKDKDGDIDAKDFAILRKSKTERKLTDAERGEIEEKVDMQTKSYIDDIASAINRNPKMKMMKPFVNKFKKLAMATGNVKSSLEKAMPDYVAGADIAKLLNMGEEKMDELTKAQEKLPPALQKAIKAKEKKEKNENYDMGTPENTKSKLDATPGQSSDDWQQQVDTMQKKNASMREALAKVWGVDEGHNPFAEKITRGTGKKGLDKSLDKLYGPKKGSKKEDKTMTGKSMTKVEVEPDMKEIKLGKKNVR